MRLASLLFAALALPAYAQSGGSLTPPGAPTAPTMKSLDEVEARIAISGPATIDTPGSYYLTENLVFASTAIKILTSNVSLDLNGFSIQGQGSGVAISVTAGTNVSRNINIRNGSIENFFTGIPLSNVGGVSLTDLNITGNETTGIGIGTNFGTIGNEGVTIRGCNIRNTDTGMLFRSLRGSVIEGCTVNDCVNQGILLEGTGNILTRCTVSGVGGSGST